MLPMFPPETRAAKTEASYPKTTLKYLLVAALAALIFIFAYRKLRPYVIAVRKFINIASNIVSPNEPPHRTELSENKLVRCIACGTWVPASRAIGGSRYCSTECLEKPRSERRKVSRIR
jgi:predicted nucleic acid-binding Zn ribbon protein